MSRRRGNKENRSKENKKKQNQVNEVEKERQRIEYINSLFEFITDDELKRYYDKIKRGEILIRGHNHLQVILALHSNSYEEWKEFMRKALSPIVNVRLKRNTGKISVRFVEGECSCGYDRVISPVGVVSGSGTPPPFYLCPMGFITLLTLARVNKYVVVSNKKINDRSIEIIKDKLYVTYTDNDDDIGEGTIVFRKIHSGERYTPLERVF